MEASEISGISMNEYLWKYQKHALATAGQDAGDIMAVILNEAFTVGTKTQICDQIPNHTSRHEDSKYRSRTQGQFKNLEEIGLIGQIPYRGRPGEHVPLVNPEIRIELARLLTQTIRAPDVPEDISLGSELQLMEGVDRYDLSQSIMWYIGRAIANNSLPYSDSDESHSVDQTEQTENGDKDSERGESVERFGISTLLFGYIDNYFETLSEPKIEFDTFGPTEGDRSNGYHISGELNADEMKLRRDLNVGDTFESLRRSIRVLLFVLFRHATFDRDASKDLGDAEFDYTDFSAHLAGEYEDADPSEIPNDAIRAYQLFEYIEEEGDVSVERPEPDKLEFELNIPSTSK